MKTTRHYLDHNATAPVLPEAREAALRAMLLVGNPSSVHHEGRAAKRELEKARAEVAALISARPQDIIFTSGGTEANHLALRGLRLPKNADGAKDAAAFRPLIINATEHESVLAAASALDGRPDTDGVTRNQMALCPVDQDGLIDFAALRHCLAESSGPALVSIMLANNETGVIQPIAAIARIVHEAGGLLHCDAVQGLGRLPIDVGAADGPDCISFSAHKIGALKGVGCLWLRPALGLMPFITGGGQEQGRRSGTENLPAIASFGAAALHARQQLGAMKGIAALRSYLEQRLAEIAPEAEIYGRAVERIANTSAIRMPGLSAETQVMSFDLEGIAVSSGAACSSGKVRTSHVLKAMGAASQACGEVIRLSMGVQNTMEDIERFLEVWKKIYDRARSRRPLSMS
ncbi:MULTISPECIES: cysteine desulfurase family protein [unclassified Iodidimonas]|uniref:cysteine desulfurase family protein n=1 Tax=unclassified Iodidimonas TaxID=2626145 RepID=UPI002482D046|nr:MULTISPECIES: cysteine desulfurase family protein [unclassified Iodidimonas]